MEEAPFNFFIAVQLVWWPFSKLLNAVRVLLSPFFYTIVFLVSPIWIVGTFLLLPFVHLAKGLFHIITVPLQVKWLERIETLYIYLGTAGLIGCMTGAVLYFMFNFLSSSLSIDATSRLKLRQGRTTADFRSARRKKQDRMLAPALPTPPNQAVLDRGPERRGRGLLSQTIAEEEDSDF